MKLVVLGSQGFIFSHVIEHFLEKGWEVHGFDNLSAGSHPELVPVFEAKGMKFYEEDVSFMPAVDKIIRINPDYIIHAAAISDVDYSIKHPLKTMTANNNATTNAFEAARQCRNLKKLLYVSTDEVYGECDHPKKEDEVLFPRNPYAASKAYGSILRPTYENTFPELKDKTCETRFCNVFGPRQDDRKIIPAIVRALAGGKPIQLHNGGAGYRQWLYVKEIPHVIELILEKGDRTYNVTSGKGLKVIELIEMAEKIVRRAVPTIPGKRSGMDLRYELDGSRLHDDLGWEMRYPFAEAYKALIEGNPL